MSDVVETTEEKAAGASGTAQPLHGRTNVGVGLFSGQGVDRDVMSAHYQGEGIARILPKFPSVFTDPYYATITGFTADTGSEPTTPCSDAPYAFMKACELTAQFGRVIRDTKTIEIDDAILRLNRGDNMDLRLLNFSQGQRGMLPGNINPEQALNIMTMNEMLIAGTSLMRKVAGHYWNGSPANNNAGQGYMEMPGLANQIATGQKDARTGTVCPSLDSDVKDFALQNINGTGNRNIVEYLSMLEYFIYDNAEQTGMLPAKWAFCMRPQMWQALSEVWPCQYNTNKCASAANNPASATGVVIEGSAMNAERQAMRDGMYIDVNGRRHPVVTDPFITELTNITKAGLAAGEYAGSIFMVPLTVVGNYPVTYIEHVDYTQINGDVANLRGKEMFWSDDGKFLWAYDAYGGFCYKLKVKTEQRVVLRTPQLAGRIDNVKYVPLQHLRDVEPASPYWLDGGVSMRSLARPQAAWVTR
jgi:hypothetical protein